MDHFYHDLPGWFDWQELYRRAVAEAPEGGHLVEVGTWLGRSLAFLAVEALNSGKTLQIDAVDLWVGVGRSEFNSEEGYQHQQGLLAVHGSLMDACRLNLTPVLDHVRLIQADGIEAASLYAPESLDLVFLDDDHAGPHVYQEILAWWPKVKPGGMLAGHDLDWKGVEWAVNLWQYLTGIRVYGERLHTWWARKEER